MTKKFYVICTLFAVLVSIGIIGYNRIGSTDIDDLTMANIEALSNSEMAGTGGIMECSYFRDEIVCGVSISAEMAVKVIGIKIVKGKVNGELYAVGNECRSGGDSTCQRLGCETIYEMLFGKTN